MPAAQSGRGGSYSSTSAAKKKIANLKKTDSKISATTKAIKKMTDTRKRIPKPSASKPYGR